MGSSRYELRHGSYYLIQKVARRPGVNPNGERILLMVDQVAVCINTAWGVLVGHGSPDDMEKRAKATRKELHKLGDDEAVMGVLMVTFEKGTAAALVNEFLENPMKALEDNGLVTPQTHSLSASNE